MSKLATRKELADLRDWVSSPDDIVVLRACNMAAALLDVADLLDVPPDGDVVAAVKQWEHDRYMLQLRYTELQRTAERDNSICHGALDDSEERIQKLEAERDRLEAALSNIASAWERYQRGDLSREEFEGTVADRVELDRRVDGQ